jgi:hypothetical protein
MAGQDRTGDGADADDIFCYILGDLDAFFLSFEAGDQAEQYDKDQMEYQERLAQWGKLAPPLDDASLD